MNKLQLYNLAFELTDKCNLACRYCYNIWKIPGVTEHKTFNSYKQAIKTLTKIFEQADIKNIALTGGEPFLSERFLEVALFCRMQDKTITLITNGSIGTTSDYKALIKMGVGLFELPIHSSDYQIHDNITQVKGSWQKSIASIYALQKEGAYIVPVIVLTKYNIEGLDKTLEFISSLGLSRIMLNRYNIGGNGCENPASVSANHKQLKDAFTIANNKSKELNLKITSNVCSPDCLLNPKDYPQIMFGHCSENVLLKPITLDINGNIRLCNHSPIVAGNIFNQNIKDILYSPYAESWNTTIPEYCSKCELWEKCRGGCRAASEQCGLGLGHVDPILTELF